MSWLRPVDRWLCEEVLPHKHAYLGLARRLTRNAEAANDIVQDVYAEVLQGDTWKTARDPKAFVLRIVYCRSINWLNRQKIVPLHPLPEYEGLSYADFGPDAFDRLSGREELEAVLEVLADMPVRCRQVITMRRIEELPPKEIARRLGIDMVTVRRHMARGVAILTKRLGQRGSSRKLPIIDGQGKSASKVE